MASINTAFTALSGICILLNLVPFVWQVRHGNSGPSCLIFWTIVGNTNNLINSIIWRNDADVRAKVWCDISAKLKLGAALGNAASAMCIVRFLALVISPSASVLTRKDLRRRRLFDYGLSLGVPAIAMALHIIFQPSRFAISRVTGCVPTAVNTWAFWICYVLWVPLIYSVAALLSIYVIIRLIQHRRDLRRLVVSSQSALNTSRFLRLLALSMLYLAINLPMSIVWVRSTVASSGEYIDYDWDFIHQFFPVVLQYPGFQKVSVVHFLYVMAGCIVLLFFGFSSEAMAYYGNIARALGLGSILESAQRFFHKDNVKSTTGAYPLKSFQSSRDRQYPATVSSGRNSIDDDLSAEKPYKGPFAGVDATDGDDILHSTGSTGVQVLRQQEVV